MASAEPGTLGAVVGLSAAEVRARVADGRANELAASSSRSVREILQTNVFTRFNAMLGILFVVIISVGATGDALFGVMLVVNTTIGIVQEVRAKRVLDKLFLLTAPTARVVRDGGVVEVAARDVVIDDLLVLTRGDQVVADGYLVSSDGLEVDESLLSGEAEPLPKRCGDEVLSGSFAAAGEGRYRAARVGQDAYAQQLEREARRYDPVHSQLQHDTNRLLRGITWVMVPAAVLLVVSQLSQGHQSLTDALRASVAGVGSMVPEGLVVLTTVAFAVGASRLARRRVLVQELAGLEGLARVDIVCIDKTGTLTEPEMAVRTVERLGPLDPTAALGALAATDAYPNASMRAVASAAPPPGTGWTCTSQTPFSSARKWIAATFASEGTWILGAPEVVLSAEAPPEIGCRVNELAANGSRVLLLARAQNGTDDRQLPADREPVALVALEERLRPDVLETVRYLLHQGITIKVISGDDPLTAASVAARAGIPGTQFPVDAGDLPTDIEALAAAVEQASVFGRVSPYRKQAVVGALKRSGHVVAMAGDGVNDVAALKAADLGIAMGGGSPATRAVAQIVLLDNSFASLPAVLAEGRRVIANIERVANLFLTKTVYAIVIAVAIALTGLPYPFFPRHLTVINVLTIGFPAFVLALGHSGRRAEGGFLRRLLRFTIPAGITASAATLVCYEISRQAPHTTLLQARTDATIALFTVALAVLTILARPLQPARAILVATMAASFVTVLLIPAARRPLDFMAPPPRVVAVTILVSAALSAAGAVVLYAVKARADRSADRPL